MFYRRYHAFFCLLLLLVSTISSACAEPIQSDSITFMVFGDPAELKAYHSLVTSFEEKHPNIKVELIHIPDQADYRRRMGADFAANTPADVLLINYRRYASLAAKDALEPLGPYLDESNVIQESDFYPEAIQPFYFSNQLICIPQNLSSLVIYYNKDLFDQAGLAYPSDDWTWDEFLQAAISLTKDNDNDEVTDQHGVGIEASLFRLAPFVWQNGGEIINDPYEPKNLTLDDPASLEALNWFVELQTKHHVVPNQVEESAEDSESRFQNGRLAMFFNSRRGTPTYREITGFDWDVAALPQNKQPAGILHADGYCMPSIAKNKDLIWTFIEFANSPEGQTIVAKSGRTVPSLKAVAESSVFLDPNAKPQNSIVFLNTFPYIRAVPVMATWVDIENIVGKELQQAFYGNISVEQAIENANTLTQEYFNELDE
jgi:multiple sugar transport system substrate-binding protein